MNQQNTDTPPIPRTSFALAPMSSGIAAMTWIFCLAAFGLPVVLFFAAPSVWISLLLATIMWAVCRFVWCFYRPVRFEICSEGLRIVWRWRSLLIGCDEITEVVSVSKSDLGFVIRTCGAGGLWGGFGRFWSRKMGRMLVYASRSDGLVCIRRGDDRPLIITPDSPEEFISSIRGIRPAEGVD